MWDFDADELAFFFFSAAAAIVLTVKFCRDLFVVDRLLSPPGPRILLLFVPIACVVLIYYVLANWSDPQTVRGHDDYMLLFMAGGILWTMVPAFVAPLTGIRLRDDVVERNNRPAALALCGMIIGNALCYAGGNIGQGPTIWTTIIPALLATAALAICLIFLRAVTSFGSLLTVERHLPSGLIVALFCITAGADFGWAVSGDFQSWPGTMDDFLHRSWPAAILLLCAIVTLRAFRPRVVLAGAV